MLRFIAESSDGDEACGAFTDVMILTTIPIRR
jgi:hypothetical protein